MMKNDDNENDDDDIWKGVFLVCFVDLSSKKLLDIAV